MLLGYQTCSQFTAFDIMGQTGGRLCVQLANGKKLVSARTYDTGHGKVPFFPILQYTVDRTNIIPYLKRYSPAYVDAKHIFNGVPKNLWPPGSAALLAAQH
jgi:hypothetical protein